MTSHFRVFYDVDVDSHMVQVQVIIAGQEYKS